MEVVLNINLSKTYVQNHAAEQGDRNNSPE